MMTCISKSVLKSYNFLTRQAFKKVGRVFSYSTQPQEKLVYVKSQKINYLQTGNGTNNILCFPGFLGTIWSDFKPQIEGLDKNKFTITIFDPPGHGCSRPPERFRSSHTFYEEDADYAYELMKSLAIQRFSLLGWSDGGISSMILAAKYPEVVEKLAIWGSNSFMLPEDVATFELLGDLDKWSDKAKKPVVELYGENTLRKLQKAYYNTMKSIFDNGGDICSTLLKDIKCPTLILHGDKDPLVGLKHPKYLLENIKGAKLHRFPEGKHNVHLRYAEEFNKIVSTFLLKESA